MVYTNNTHDIYDGDIPGISILDIGHSIVYNNREYEAIIVHNTQRGFKHSHRWAVFMQKSSGRILYKHKHQVPEFCQIIVPEK
jgi:hypothetical protein